jgi:hypothetical protein
MFNDAVSLNQMRARGLRIWPIERPVNSQFQFHDRQFGWPEPSLLEHPLSSLILLARFVIRWSSGMGWRQHLDQ